MKLRKSIAIMVAAVILMICWAALAHENADASERTVLLPREAENGLWGYSDVVGNWLIEPQFDWAGKWRGDYAMVSACGEGANGIINREGEYVLAPEYSISSGTYEGWGSFGTWEEGFYLVWKPGAEDGLYGFFDVRSGFFSGLKYECVWDVYGNGDLIPIVETREGVDYLGYAHRMTGEIVIPCEYYLLESWEANSFQEGVAAMAYVGKVERISESYCEEEPGEYFLMNDKGEIIPLSEGVSPMPVSPMSEGLIAVKNTDTGAEGYADGNGNIVIEPQFYCAGEFYEGVAQVTFPDDTDALIDREGNIVLTEETETFPLTLSENTAELGKPCLSAYNSEEYGFLDERGRVVMPPQFTYAEDFRGDYALVEVDSRVDGEKLYGIIDSNGQWAYAPDRDVVIYSGVSIYSGAIDEKVYVIFDYGKEKCGFFDIETGFFSGLNYDEVLLKQNSEYSVLIPVEVDGLAGYADRKTGEIIIPCRYAPENTKCFFGDYAVTGYVDGEFILTDKAGSEYYAPEGTQLKESGIVGDGLFPVIDENTQLTGYMDLTGKIRIEPQYEVGYSFHNGHAVAGSWMENDGLFSIDTRGNEVEPASKPGIEVSIAYNESHKIEITGPNGESIFPEGAPAVQSVGSFSENGVAWYGVLIETEEEREWCFGLFSGKGEVTTPPVFRQTSVGRDELEFSEGLMPAMDAETGKAGFVDEAGKWGIPPVFDDVVQPFKNGTAWMQLGNERVLIDREGNILFSNAAW